jgi:hypothetical protein
LPKPVRFYDEIKSFNLSNSLLEFDLKKSLSNLNANLNTKATEEPWGGVFFINRILNIKNTINTLAGTECYC